MISGSFISLLSAAFAIVAIFLVFSIFNKVFQEQYKRPWFFIGISSIIFSLGQLLTFSASLGYYLGTPLITELVLYIADFLVIAILSYGLLLEVLILKFFKGKFVKMKFIPVQEGTLGGELDINVTHGQSYFAYKKDKNFYHEQFVQATKKGFEGFLLTEENPKEIRGKHKLEKTPIAWITQIDKSASSEYVNESLNESTGIVDPLQLNNIISYIDNFLEQSENPFILVDINLMSRVNNFSILEEFLKYIDARVKKNNGILICFLGTQTLANNEVEYLRGFLKEIED